jgi:hypothetical protein
MSIIMLFVLGKVVYGYDAAARETFFEPSAIGPGRWRLLAA